MIFDSSIQIKHTKIQVIFELNSKVEMVQQNKDLKYTEAHLKRIMLKHRLSLI